MQFTKSFLSVLLIFSFCFTQTPILYAEGGNGQFTPPEQSASTPLTTADKASISSPQSEEIKSEKILGQTPLQEPSLASVVKEETSNPQEEPRELERYDFERAVASLQKDVATAVILENLTKENLKELVDLDMEIGIAVLHGEILLFTSGNKNEITVQAPVLELLKEASFISHTHPADAVGKGPSVYDIARAVLDPKVEYVISKEGVYSYNHSGILNGGVPSDYQQYIETLAQAVSSSQTNETYDPVKARAALNQFIYEMDLLNNPLTRDEKIFRTSGSVDPNASLTSADITPLPGNPQITVAYSTPASASMQLSGADKSILTYNTNSVGWASGGYAFDDFGTVGTVETADLSGNAQLVFGLDGHPTNGSTLTQAKLEVIDYVNNVEHKATVILNNLTGTEQFWAIPASQLAEIDLSKVRLIYFTIEGTSKTGTLNIEIKHAPVGIVPNASLTSADLTPLPGNPQTAPLGSASMTTIANTSTLTYNTSTVGWSGGGYTFDDFGTVPIETADLSGNAQLVFGLDGHPTNGSTLTQVKLEVKDYVNGAEHTATVILNNLTGTEQFWAIPTSQLTGIDLTKIRAIYFIAEGLNKTGTLNIEINRLVQSILPNSSLTSADLTILPGDPQTSSLGSASMTARPNSSTLTYDTSTVGWSGGGYTFDDFGTLAVETADLSGNTQLVFGLDGHPTAGTLTQIKLEVVDYVGSTEHRAFVYLSGLTGTEQFWAIPTSQLTGIDLTKIRAIYFIAEGLNQTGTLNIEIKKEQSLTFLTPISQTLSATNSALTQWGGTVNDVRTADVNGDGLDDIIARDNSGTWWAAISKLDNSGAITTSENIELTQWGGSVSDVRVGDVNGDGLDDIIARDGSGNLWAAISHASGGANTASDNIILTQWAGSINDFQMADINGDGLDDIIARDNSGTWWAAISKATNYVNTASDTVQLTQWGGTVNDVRTADVNGDGLDDIIARDNSGTWWAAISKLDNSGAITTSENIELTQWGGSVSDVRVGDVNGDGLDDIIARDGSGNLWAAISHASGGANTASDNIILTQWAGSINDFQMADINGDGLDDIIARDNSGTWWAAISKATNYVNTASDTVQLTQWGGTVNDVRTADVNGDGLADIIARDNSGTWWAAISNTSTTLTTLPNTPSVNLIKNPSDHPSTLAQPNSGEIDVIYGALSGSQFVGPSIYLGAAGQDLTSLLNQGIVFGVKSSAVDSTMKLEFEDINGAKAVLTLSYLDSTTQYFNAKNTNLLASNPQIALDHIRSISFFIDHTNVGSNAGDFTIYTDGLFALAQDVNADPTLNASNLSTLPQNSATTPELPFTAVLGGSGGDSAYVQYSQVDSQTHQETGIQNIDMFYDFRQAGTGDWTGTTISFDDYGTSGIESANLSAFSELVFGVTGPTGARVKLEFEDAAGHRESRILLNLTSTEKYFKITQNSFTDVNWGQMRFINIVIERGSVPIKSGVIEVNIKGLKDPRELDAQKELFRQQLIQDNMKYFTDETGTHVGGINQATQYPYDSIYYESGTIPRVRPWTQPTSIGFYAQILGDAIRGRNSAIDKTSAITRLTTMINQLSTDQARFGWNCDNSGTNCGLLPWFRWLDGTLGVVANPVIGLGDNSNLAQSLAAMVGALEGGSFSAEEQTQITHIIDTAMTILNNMKKGFEAFYDTNTGQFYHDINADKNQPADFRGHVDRLTNEFRSTIAFLVSFYGGSKITRSAWDTLDDNAAAYRTYQDSHGNTIENMVPYQGAAFQMLWPLLRANEQNYVEIQAMLKNFIYSASDYAAANEIPGFPSAGFVPDRVDYTGQHVGDYSGALGIAELSETQINPKNPGYTTANVGNTYALASAFTFDPNFVIDWLFQIQHQNPAAISQDYGFYDSLISGVEVGKAHYAIDQGAIILALSGHGGDDFDVFMQNRGKYDTFRGLYSDLRLGLAMTSQSLASPPTFPTNTFTIFNRLALPPTSAEGVTGTGFLTGTTQEYGIEFQYSGQTTTSGHYWNFASIYNANGKKLKIDYSVSLGLLENSPRTFSIILKDSSGNQIGSVLPVTVNSSLGIHTIDLLIPATGYENVAGIELVVNAANDPDGLADFYIHALQFRNV